MLISASFSIVVEFLLLLISSIYVLLSNMHMGFCRCIMKHYMEINQFNFRIGLFFVHHCCFTSVVKIFVTLDYCRCYPPSILGHVIFYAVIHLSS